MLRSKQIRAADDYPLSTMSERQALSPDPHSNGGELHPHTNPSPTSSHSAKEKKSIFDDDDDDNEPVKDLLMYYAKNSSMHGVPTIVGSELYRGRHIFWICVVCVMAMFLGTVVYVQMKDYYSYPTVTSVDVHYVGENDFPAITVCDLNFFSGGLIKYFLPDNYTAYYLTQLTEITGFYQVFFKRYFKDKAQPPPEGNVSTQENIQKLLDGTYKAVENNPLLCSWGDYYWTPCPATSTRITDMGVCATIDVRKLARKRDPNSTEPDDQPHVGNAMRGLTLYFNVDMGVIPYRIYQYEGYKIILHEPDQDPLPLSSGFMVAGDTTVEVDISKTVKEGLPPPYKAFGSGSCVDTESDSFDNPLKRFSKYTSEVCEEECFIDFAVETCGGCKHFLHPGNESICAVDHLADCYREAQMSFYGGKTTKDGQSRKESLRTRTCDCPMPCKSSVYKAAVTSSPFKATQYWLDLQKQANKKLNHRVAYVHFFYSDPVVSKMRQVAVHSTEGLLGNIGGHIGLFMGFSLITVAEMLELIFLLVTRGRHLDEKVKRHKENEAAMQAVLQSTAPA